MEPQNNVFVGKSLIIMITVFIAGGVIGIAADPYLPSALSNAKKGYQSGFAAARKVIEDSTLGGFFKSPDDIRVLSGTVTAVSGDRITFHIQSTNPFDDSALANRVALINASTTVIKLTPSVGTTTKSTVPAQFVTSPATVLDIKIGDFINVLALENVKIVKEFSARGIQIQPETTGLIPTTR